MYRTLLLAMATLCLGGVGNQTLAQQRYAPQTYAQQTYAQQNDSQQADSQGSLDSPMTRMRPIGAPSAVDQFRQGREPRFQETAMNVRQQNFNGAAGGGQFADNSVRQTVMLQQGGIQSPPLPADLGAGAMTTTPPSLSLPGNSLPPNVALPGAIPNTGNPNAGIPNTIIPNATMPGAALPGGVATPGQIPLNPGRALPINPNLGGQNPNVLSSSDLTPIQQPQLNTAFANIDNCNCVSGPGSYRAASGYGCGSTLGYVTPQSYQAPAPQIAAPAVMPQTITPGAVVPGNIAPGNIAPGAIVPGAVIPNAQVGAVAAPPRALISLGQQNFPVQVGQGLWGQPVAYVPGQGVRNWVRYFFP